MKITFSKVFLLFCVIVLAIPKLAKAQTQTIQHDDFEVNIIHDKLTIEVFSKVEDAESYSWSFGDGSPDVSGQKVSYTYKELGIYPLTHRTRFAMIPIGTPPVLVSTTMIPIGSLNFNLCDIIIDGTTQDPNDICVDLEPCGNSSLSSSSDDEVVSWTICEPPGSTNCYTTSHSNPNIDPGDYTVTVTYADGTTATDDVTILDSGFGDNLNSPNSNFTTSCNGLQVNFNSSADNGSFDWDFGDGNTSDLDNPTHTYDAYGTYIVSFTHTTSSPCFPNASNTNNCLLTISPTGCTLECDFCTIGADYLACGDFEVDFSINHNPPGMTPSHGGVFFNTNNGLWDYGDGTMGTEFNHTYSNYGTYTVVYTENDCSDTFILNLMPCSDCMGATYESCGDQSIEFTSNTIGLGTYEWDFGDGNTSCLANPTHTYDAYGTYMVSYQYTNLQGEVCVEVIEITIGACSPCQITASPMICGGYQFESAYNYPINPDNNYAWSFGDGTTSNETNPTHNYDTPGTYTVDLTVCSSIVVTSPCIENPQLCDPFPVPLPCESISCPIPLPDGTVLLNKQAIPSTTTLMEYARVKYTQNCCTTSIELTVGESGTHSGFFDINHATCGDLRIGLISNVIGTGTFSLDLGDGSPIISGAYNSNTNNYTYDNYGNYDITYTLNTTCNGQAVSNTYTSSVSLQACEDCGNATYENCDAYSVDFTSNTTGIGSHCWEFGDGTSSAQANPTHTYNSYGTYTVTYQFTNEAGDLCVETMEVTVEACPGCTIQANPSPCGGLAYNFDVDVNKDLTAPYNYAWNFGDNTTSSSSSPNHTYSTPGVYEIEVTVCEQLIETCPKFSVPPDCTIEPIDPCILYPENCCPDGSLPPCYILPYPCDPIPCCIDGSDPPCLEIELVPVELSRLQYSKAEAEAYPSFEDYARSIFPSQACCTTTMTLTVEATDTTTTPDLEVIYGACDALNVTINSNFAGNWNLGDGTMALASTNVTHTYDDYGTYTVTQTGWHNCNGFTPFTSSVTVVLEECPCSPGIEEAMFTADFDICGDLMVDFSSGNAANLSDQWIFGDDNNTTTTITGNEQVTHTYADYGTYEVSYIIANNEGCTDTATQQITLTPEPDASFTIVSQTCDGSDYCVTVEGVEAGTWSFNGAGNTVLNNNPNQSTYCYDNNGTYAIKHQVESNICGPIITTQSVVIDCCEFDISMTADYEQCGRLKVKFTHSGTGNTTGHYACVWDFGDGNTDACILDGPINPTHTYDDYGTYTVIYSGSRGCGSDTDTLVITLLPVADASFTIVDTDCENNCVTVEAVQAGGIWDFGGAGTLNNPTANPTTFCYDDNGDYTITYTVESQEVACPGSDTYSTNVTIEDFPDASFYVEYDLCDGLEVSVYTGTYDTIYVADDPDNNYALSYNPPTDGNTHSWDFGDGTTSTNADETHTYADYGTYTITHTETNSCGTATYTYTIELLACDTDSPNPDFTAAHDECGDVSVIFNSNTNATDTHFWDFGDGNTSTDPNPTHIYSAYGDYTVVHTTESCTTNGSTTTCTINTSVVNISLSVCPDCMDCPAADANFTVSYNCYSGVATFESFTANNAECSAFHYWDLGNGNIVTNQSTVVQDYDINSTYEIMHIVSNACGIDTTYQSLEASCCYFICGCNTYTSTFTYATDCDGLTVHFTGQTSGYGNWDFGDGNTSNEGSPSHTYDAPGTYTVTYGAGYIDCPSTSKVIDIIVGNGGVPNAEFTLDDYTCGLDIEFTSASDCANDVTFAWNFGDGTIINNTTGNLTHTYNTAGTYTISQTVTNACGTATHQTQVTIEDCPECDDPSFDYTYDCESKTIELISYLPEGDNVHTWDFGNGVTGFGDNPSYTYANDGTYTITHNVSNDCGTFTTSLEVEVTGCIQCLSPHNSSFTMDYAPCGELSVTFTADETGEGISHLWDLDNNITATGAEVTYTFPDYGTYTIVHEIDGPCGGDTYTFVFELVSCEPTDDPDFTIEYDGCGDLSLDFFATINMDNDYSSISHFWDFGDGTTSTDPNPIHIYNDYGTYTIVYISTYCKQGIDKEGEPTYTKCAQMTDIVTITLAPCPCEPNPSFEMTTIDCHNLMANFSAVDAGSDHAWNFGDGNVDIDAGNTVTHTFPAYGTYYVTHATSGTCVDSLEVVVEPCCEAIPDASFEYDSDCGESSTVDFFPTDNDPNTNHEWDFGDGNTSTDAAPTHTFGNGNTHTVIHTTTNQCGTTIDSLDIYIPQFATICPTLFSIEYEECPLTVCFESYYAGHVDAQYGWSFNTFGVIINGGVNNNTSYPNTTASICYTFPDYGTYTITNTVSMPCGTISSSIRLTIEEGCIPCTDTSFEYMYDCVTTSVSFNAHLDEEDTEHLWDFGDGIVSFGNPVEHTYNGTGDYEVTHTIFNECGQSTTTELITLSDCELCDTLCKPRGYFIIKKDDCGDLMVELESYDAQYDPNGSHSWDFGDNSPISTDAMPTHTYDTYGEYDITHTFIGSCGDSITIVQSIKLETCDPNEAPNIAIDPDTCGNLTVQFSNPFGGTNGTESWSFGDNTTSTDNNPMHTFADYGTYEIIYTREECSIHHRNTGIPYPSFIFCPQRYTIGGEMEGMTTATYANNRSYCPEAFWELCVTEVDTLIITLEPCDPCDGMPANANFTQNQPSCYGTTVDFTSATTGDADYTWDFGDGTVDNTGTNSTPSHTYDTYGTYTVTHAVTTDCGVDIYTQVIEVGSCCDPEPMIDFTYSYDCNDPRIVSFNSTTSTFGYHYWEFGDGEGDGSGTNFDPNHTYDDYGTYEVNLQVFIPQCGLITKTLIIELYPDASPEATFDVNTGCGLDKTFTSHSIGLENATYAWDFGDGNTATLPAPNHTYANAGSYQVTLTVTNNDCGTSSTYVQMIDVAICPDCDDQAITAFDYDYDCATGLVTFTANLDDEATAHYWNFGDPAYGMDNYGIGSPIEHTYAPGTYEVIHTIENEACGIIADTVSINLLECPCDTLAATFTMEYDSCGNLTVVFTADEQAGIHTWDFGDNNASATTNPVYTYTQEGTYTIIHMVSSDCGVDTSSQTITIFEVCNPCDSIPALNPDFDYTVDVCDGSVSVTAVDNNGNHTWDWGDGNTSTANPADHIYTQSGTYTIVHTISNDCETVSSEQTATIEIIPALDPSFEIVSDDCDNLSVSLIPNDNSGDHTWNWGDGTINNNSTHTYSNAGTYTIVHTIANECETISTQQTITLDTTPAIDASFTMQYDSCGNLTVVFTANEQAGTHTWDFGDNNISAATNPVYTYTTAGTYTITHTVTNDCGTATTTQTITVLETCPCDNIPPLNPNFDYTVDPCNGSVTVTAADNSGDHTWNWGDDTIDSNSTHTYSAAGTYTIIHTIDNGCEIVSTQQTVTVDIIPALDASFDAASDACNGTVTVTAADDSGDHTWNWGDGIVDNNSTHNYSTSGTYTIVHTISNDCETVSSEQTVTIEIIPALDPSFEIVSDSCGNLTVSVIPNDNNGTHTWNWGDGVIDNNLTHTYSASGTYAIMHTISNDCETVSSTTNVSVNETCPDCTEAPNGDFDIDYDCGSLTVTLTATGDNPLGTNYIWFLGDGNLEMGIDMTTLTYTYEEFGTYFIALGVNNGCGSWKETTEFTLTDLCCETLADPCFDAAHDECLDLSVEFTSYDTNPDITHTWDFGDGNTSMDIDPTHTYAEAGTYTVTHIITEACGTADTCVIEITIVDEIPTDPTITATYNQCGDLMVNFTTASSNIDGAQFIWFFGDGSQISTDPSPTHTFDDYGTYLVNVKVLTPCGQWEQDYLEITLSPPVQPDATFELTYDECGNLTIEGMSNTDDASATHLWDFGDGNTATEADPTHTYTDYGTYTITHTVTTICGTTTEEITITMVEYIPTDPTFTATYDECGSLEVQFEAAETNNPDAIYIWFYGDGAADLNTNDGSPTHTYPDYGTYEVSLKTYTPCGGWEQFHLFITLTENITPDATFEAVVDECGLMTEFTSNNTDTDAAHFWDFGDGNTSTDANPNHVYNDYGTYTVTHTITTLCGTATETMEVTLVQPTNVSADFSVDIEECSLDAQFTGINYTDATHLWDFGDGNTSNEVNPLHTYADYSTYTVTHTVIGTCNTDTHTEIITFEAPVDADATFDVVTDNCDLSATFTSAANDASATHTWDFGDGNTSNEVDPVHTYDAYGDYVVTHTVTTNCDEDVFVSNINFTEPEIFTADFEANYEACDDDSVEFSFTGGSDDSSIQHHWDFGDGNTSTDVNPLHQYAEYGTYTVIHTAMNECITVSETLEVVLTPYTLNTTSAEAFYECGSLDVTFVAADTNPSGTNYIWLYGDTELDQGIDLTTVTHTYPDYGTYQVGVGVANACGSWKIFIEVVLEPCNCDEPLDASFTETHEECGDFSPVFTSNTTDDTVTHAWEFGDGGTSSEANPTYTYAEQGYYTVYHSVTNQCDNTLTNSMTILIQSETTDANFTAIVDECDDLTVDFESASADIPGAAFMWFFGDGNSDIPFDLTNPNGTGNGAITHTYADYGTYMVSVKTYTPCGGWVDGIMEITLTPSDPDAGFTSETDLCGGLDVSFRSAYPDGDHEWDFGDGNSSNEANPNHTYDDYGNYRVTHFVSTSCGSATSSAYANVNEPTLDALFTANHDECGSLSVNFAANGNEAGTVYEWDLGDGTIITAFDNALANHTYADYGTYQVSLTVTNNCGTETYDLFVVLSECTPCIEAPNPFFFAAYDCDDLTVLFGGINNPIGTTYIWDFGDGNTATNTQAVISHTYDTYGIYAITLTVSNECGKDTYTTSVNLHECMDCDEGPDASFDFTCDGLGGISLEVASTTGTHTWDFGDGNGSTDIGGIHIYTEFDVYCITHTVTNDCGTSSITKCIDLKACEEINAGLNHHTENHEIATNLDQKINIKIYPNPTAADITMTVPAIEADETGHIRIYDARGVLLLEQILITGQTQYVLPTHQLALGMYMSEVIVNGERIGIKKFIRLE